LNKKLLELLKILALFSIALAMLWYAFRGMDPSKIWDGIKNANVFWLFASLISGFIALYLRAYRWKLLMEPLGFEITTKKSFLSLCTGYLFNLVFPRAGEITRSTMIAKTSEIPFNSAFGTVITERILDLLCLITLILSTYFLEFSLINDFFNQYIFNPITSKFNQDTTFLLGLLAVFGTIIIILFFTLKSKIEKLPLYVKIASFLNGIAKGMASIVKSKNPIALILSTLGIWVFYYTMTYAICFCFLSTSNLSFTAGLVLLVVSGIGMSAPVQGGIGIFHIMVSNVLLLYNVEKTDGLLYATLLHGSQMVFIILIGGISFVTIMLETKKKTNDIQ
jgi:glycosyltransferase 2 family protein